MKGYKYTVNKRRANRLAYRFLGFMFLLVATLQAFTMIHGYAKHLVLTALFVTFVGAYGIYLVVMSFRKQAFSATYIFDDTGFTIEHKYGTTHYDFDQIKHVTMVIPDENMIFYILNVFTEKERYTISFMMQKELCENIYEFMIDNNGKELLKCVNQYIEQWGLEDGFKKYVNEDCTFCGSLVDRIVPGRIRDPKEVAELEEKHGYADPLLDVGEVFGVWVIDDYGGSASPGTGMTLKQCGGMSIDPVVVQFLDERIYKQSLTGGQIVWVEIRNQFHQLL